MFLYIKSQNIISDYYGTFLHKPQFIFILVIHINLSIFLMIYKIFRKYDYFVKNLKEKDFYSRSKHKSPYVFFFLIFPSIFFLFSLFANLFFNNIYLFFLGFLLTILFSFFLLKYFDFSIISDSIINNFLFLPLNFFLITLSTIIDNSIYFINFFIFIVYFFLILFVIIFMKISQIEEKKKFNNRVLQYCQGVKVEKYISQKRKE